ncbi:hypothetical protein K457DRAFT_826358 [Linnemannia elongata AG-77]|uniref:Uncharacterized protein n=1 Tax=Linnemannia elongata AG-77 TaxID=1314771 RepID=A0A197JJH3_9FUNG|nr:hypothetical protein K457DRAFT_826358 [Linnemannia elongata AG-77]
MPSSPSQGNSPPSPPSLVSSKHPEIASEGQHVISQLEHTTSLGRMSSKSGDVPTIVQGSAAIQLGPSNLLSPLGHHTGMDGATDVDHGPSDASDARSVTSSRSSKSGFRKRLSRFFKGDPKVKETMPASAASSAPITLVATKGRIQYAAPTPDRNAVPVSLNLHSPANSAETSSTILNVPVTEVRPSPAAVSSIRMDIFPENIPKPTYKTDLPKQLARVDKTPQLVYCCSILSKAQRMRRKDGCSSLIPFCKADIDGSLNNWSERSLATHSRHLM